jgi:predicted nuclease of restriction endonuclease-like RecB superfamily
MLKSELILPRLQKRGDTITPLALPYDYHYLKIATDLIELVKAHVGCSQGELARRLKEYEGDSLDYRIIRGLANVLINRCVFSHNLLVDPVDLRNFLFSQGPVVSLSQRAELIANTAAEFNLTNAQVEQALFSDLLEERILLSYGEVITPKDLIARYNLEVARGVLYWAHEVDIIIRDGYKTIFKYIKLFKLMHTIYPIPQHGYNIVLYGPISPFIKSTMRYGLQFAKFLPALFLCETWRMDANVQPPETGRYLNYSLDNSCELKSHFKAAKLFDSQMEADFAAEFEAKYGNKKQEWILAREDEIIPLGDTVMIPDFSITNNKDGRRAIIEIIGFWHPKYLLRKIQKIRDAQRSDLILLVYESVNIAKEVFEKISAGEVLTFVKKPVLKEVLAAVERCAK